MGQEHDTEDKPVTMDEMIKSGIQEKKDEDAFFAIAWALTKLNETLAQFMQNQTVHNNALTYSHKQQADAVERIASGISMTGGTYTLKWDGGNVHVTRT